MILELKHVFSGYFKLAMAIKRAAMDTEKMSVQKVHDIFEEAPSQADLQP